MAVGQGYDAIRLGRADVMLCGGSEAGITPLAMAGFVSCDDLDPLRRPLNLASQILSDRMLARIREKEQLVYSIGCQNAGGRSFPGTGLMIAAAPTDPKNFRRVCICSLLNSPEV